MDVRAAVADVDDALARHAEPEAEPVESGDLAVAGGHAQNGGDLPRGRVKLELRADDSLGRYAPVERSVHDFLRRRGHDIELEPVTVDPALEESTRMSMFLLRRTRRPTSI